MNTFVLVGANVENNGDCSNEIKRRLVLGSVAMADLDKIRKDRDITLKSKTGLVQAMMFLVAMYVCKPWTKKPK